MMTNMMVILITITSFSLSTALAFYWITTYAFISIQTFIFKKLLNDKKNSNNKSIKSKLEMKRGMKYGSNN